MCSPSRSRPAGADARGDGRGLLRLRNARRSALLARRLGDRLRRHHRRSESRTGGAAPSGRSPRTARASAMALTTAPQSSTSPALETRRQGARVPVVPRRLRATRRRHAAHAGVAAAARRRRAAARHAPAERRRAHFNGRPTAPRWSSPQPHRTERRPRRRPSDVAALHARPTSSTTPAGSTTSAATSGWSTSRRRREADHLRRRLERHRPAVVARRPRDRVRVEPHRQGVRRRPQQRRLGDRRGRRRR